MYSMILMASLASGAAVPDWCPLGGRLLGHLHGHHTVVDCSPGYVHTIAWPAPWEKAYTAGIPETNRPSGDITEYPPGDDGTEDGGAKLQPLPGPEGPEIGGPGSTTPAAPPPPRSGSR